MVPIKVISHLTLSFSRPLLPLCLSLSLPLVLCWTRAGFEAFAIETAGRSDECLWTPSLNSARALATVSTSLPANTKARSVTLPIHLRCYCFILILYIIFQCFHNYYKPFFTWSLCAISHSSGVWTNFEVDEYLNEWSECTATDSLPVASKSSSQRKDF